MPYFNHNARWKKAVTLNKEPSDAENEAVFEKGLPAEEQRFQNLAHSASIGIFECDADGGVIFANPQFLRICGLANEASLGFGWTTVIHPDDRESFLEKWQRRILEGRAWEHDCRILRPDRTTGWIRVRVGPTRLSEGRAAGFVGTVVDITEQRLAIQGLQESERKFRRMFKQAGVGMSQFSAAGEFLEVNPAYCAFIGYAEEELRRMTVDQVTFEDDRELTRAMFRKTQAEPGVPVVYEKRFRRQDGTIVWGLVSVVWLFSDDCPVYGIGIVQDITLRKQAEEKLDYLAYHDPLTGLPNRMLLSDRLGHALAKSRRSKSKVAVLFIDVDSFKYINDTYGHPVGDRVLTEVAEILQGTVRQSDTLARFGGDEFVLVMEEIREVKSLALAAQKILQLLSRPIVIDTLQFHITASIGISVFPANGRRADALIRCADAAMYRAKEKGRNNFQFYSAEANARVARLLRMETSLRRALEEKQLTLDYQPQFHLATGELVGFEALVRWQHPTEGVILPEDFIPIAEETGLIIPIGRWVMEEACRQAKAWESAGFPVRMAVNISARQFRRGNLAEVVRQALQQSGLRPERLELELTESTVMDDVQRAIQTMQEITALGVHLAIDDFGLGYSSLSCLKRFPISRLKIDRSFVHDITSDLNSAAIANAVIALAKTMNLEVVAEGIEMEEQARFLRESGCEFGQGYLFCQPLPAADLASRFRG